MSQSLCKVYLHVIIHIKNTSSKIQEDHWGRLHSYIGQLVNTTGCQVICVGGVSDHVHLLCTLSRNETISHLVEEVKRNSSRWIKTIHKSYRHFSWQGGYAAFSVSESVVPKTMAYVRSQKEHHRKKTFHEEYLEFLKLYHIEYDERFVFAD